jgi:hypothetical protein
MPPNDVGERVHDYQGPPTLPALLVQSVATGGELINSPDVIPRGVTYQLGRRASEAHTAVVVMDLQNSRWETETLLRTLTESITSIRNQPDTDVVLVVATSQPAVARVVDMLATALDITVYVSPAADRLDDAKPVGKVTPVERESLSTLRALGGRVTASRFADAAAIEVTTAGNRLTKLANRGYVNRISRSRRDGDEYFSIDWFTHGDLAWGWNEGTEAAVDSPIQPETPTASPVKY